MSPAWAKWTTDAGWPATTARLWSPEAPKELLKLTPAPFGRFFEGRLEGFGVDGFRGGVADHVELAAAAEEPPEVELVLSSLPPQPAAKTARSRARRAAGRPTFTLRRRVLRAFRI